MHTLIITLFGFVLLALCYWISSRNKIRFLRYFPAIWLFFCGIHFAVGVNAGYSVQDELVVHAGVYGIPVIAWFALTQYLKRKNYSL